ncbi:MAG TPA: COX15/CtaA family protein [Bacteroidota bacterium]
MSATALYHKALHWFAVFTAVCTLFLIVAGGLVTSTGSGLAVPDWPLSYGQLMPPMVGGIFYEHGHRLVATTVGILTIILAVWLQLKEERPWLRKLGWVALVLVVIQGALGGLTVILLLPTAVSVTHATIAQTFFWLVSSVALFTSKWWIKNDIVNIQVKLDKYTLIYCISMICIVYIQLILGALMRHTGSGLAIPDFPLAYGQVLPSLSEEAMAQYNRQLIYSDIRLAAEGPITSLQIVIHLLHRLWALVVTVGVVALSTTLLKQRIQVLHRYAFLLLALLATQLTLGTLTVLTRKSFEIATAHVAVGALMLTVSALTALSVARLSGRFSFRPLYVQEAKEALT